MESVSNSTNNSFGSTASSTSPPAHTQEPSDSENERVVIKQEPTSSDAAGHADTYDRNVWAHIFDENGAICLDVDDDDHPMDDEDVAADPRRLTVAAAAASGGDGNDMESGGGTRASATAAAHSNAFHIPDPTPSSALLDNWGYYDEDMLGSSHSHHPEGNRALVSTSVSTAATMAHTPSSGMAPPLPPLLAFESTPSLESAPAVAVASTITSESSVQYACEDRYDGVTAAPSFSLALEKQTTGQPLPLSKPIVRDDGLLIVGTELAANSVAKLTEPIWNRLFITNVGSSHTPPAPQVIKVHADIRDLHWLSHSSAIAAIGSDFHILHQDASESHARERGGHWTLSAPVRRMHADTIREIAINYRSSSGTLTIASGGFDETVVLTKLGEGGDWATATMEGKIDAYDVVSSVRWHPTESSILSWTTDGGDFQIADVRARTKPQLDVALNSFLEIDQMGGLFCHEYISTSNVVLGFQSGQLLFLDLRKPRKQYCYGVMKAPLGSVGEMRRSATGTCAMFGVGGFATAAVDPLARELAELTGARPPHATQVGFNAYKTSGDFSFETSAIFAVSDNLGVVSVYATDTARSTTGMAVASTSAANSDWHERAV